MPEWYGANGLPAGLVIDACPARGPRQYHATTEAGLVTSAAAKMPDIARFSWICCNCYLSGRLLDTNAFSARETLAVKKPIETARRKPTSGSANSIQFSTLEKGQIWKTGETYVLITDAGKRLVHYRIAKTLQQRGLRIHMASIVTVQAFLKSNRAELLVKS